MRSAILVRQSYRSSRAAIAASAAGCTLLSLLCAMLPLDRPGDGRVVGAAIPFWHAALCHAADSPFEAPPPPPVPEEVCLALRELSDSSWRVRDQATRSLVATRARWAKRIPIDWQPEDAEGRWRWQRVREAVQTLEQLPVEIERVSMPEARGRVRALARAHGGEVVAGSLGPALAAVGEHARVRAMTLLAELEDFDVRPALRTMVDDPSPWVRETLCEIAFEKDRRWGEELLMRFASQERATLTRGMVGMAGKLASPRLLQQLRHAWSRQPGEVRGDIARLLCAHPMWGDGELISWMLASGEYPLLMAALAAFDVHAGRGDLRELFAVLESPYQEARLRAGALLAEQGDAKHAGYLLPHLEGADPELARLALDCLCSWGARDYAFEFQAALAQHPGVERAYCVQREPDGAQLARALPDLSEARITRAPLDLRVESTPAPAGSSRDPHMPGE